MPGAHTRAGIIPVPISQIEKASWLMRHYKIYRKVLTQQQEIISFLDWVLFHLSWKWDPKVSNFFQVPELHLKRSFKNMNWNTKYTVHSKVNSHCLASNQKLPFLKASIETPIFKSSDIKLQLRRKKSSINWDRCKTDLELQLADKDIKTVIVTNSLYVQKQRQGRFISLQINESPQTPT